MAHIDNAASIIIYVSEIQHEGSVFLDYLVVAIAVVMLHGVGRTSPRTSR